MKLPANESIIFSDEAGIYLDPSIAAVWAPCGHQPCFPSLSRKGRINLIGSVNIKTKNSWILVIPKGNSESFISYMKFLLKRYRCKKRIWLYVDRAKWHRSKSTQQWVNEQSRIFIEYLPKYSPELNPVEWEWHELRRTATHARRFNSKEECIEVVKKHFSKRIHTNKHLICQLN